MGFVHTKPMVEPILQVMEHMPAHKLSHFITNVTLCHIGWELKASRHASRHKPSKWTVTWLRRNIMKYLFLFYFILYLMCSEVSGYIQPQATAHPDVSY